MQLYRIFIEYAIRDEVIGIINDRIPEFTWYIANRVTKGHQTHVLIVEILADMKFSFIRAMCDEIQKLSKRNSCTIMILECS